MLVRFFAYGISCGPIPFVYCSEVGSVRLRQKVHSVDTTHCFVSTLADHAWWQTLALSRNAFNLTNLISSCVSPYLTNPTAANLKGKSAWISVTTIILVFIWSYFRFPETKGRTFEELDILFGESRR